MKRKKNLFSAMRRLASIILAAGTLMSLLTLTGCGEKATLDFKELITVKTINGINGEGYALLSTDSDKALALLGHLNEASAISLLNSFNPKIINENGKLSNGDKLVVKVETDEKLLKEAKVRVENTELTFDVSGLPIGIKSPEDLEGDTFEKMKALAKDKLDEEIARLTNPNELQSSGEISKNDIAIALTNSHSVDYGIDIKIPKIENVEFVAAYMFNVNPATIDVNGFGTYNNYNDKDGQFFTEMLFSADASFTAKREKSLFYSEIDLADTGKYVFAVYIKAPTIDASGNITSEVVSVNDGGLTEQDVVDSLNSHYAYDENYALYSKCQKAK